MTRSALMLGRLGIAALVLALWGPVCFFAGRASAEEFRWPCFKVFSWYGQPHGTPLNDCELVLDGETGWARIYLPEPQLDGLAISLVVLMALARGRAGPPCAPRSG